MSKLVDWATEKAVRDTPEEAVRQDYEQVLHDDYGYAPGQMDIEVPIQRGSQRKEKADIVIYKTADRRKRDQGRDILGIVETKRKDRRDGIKQLSSYMTATGCSWGVWTNGSEIEYLYKEPTGEVKRNLIFQIPKRGESIEDIGTFSKKNLKPASNLKLIFRRLLNTLYTNTNISRREKLGNEMVRLLFCKLYDEQYDRSDIPRFRVGINDASNDFVDTAERVRELFDRVKSNLKEDGIFDNSEKITLDAKSVAYIVGELQMYSLTGTDEDAVGDAFEVFAESKLVGEKGEFFTPRQVVRIAIDLIDPKPGDTILDPACGSGGFLIFALEHIWEKMRRDKKWKGMPPNRFEKEKTSIAEKAIHGIDKEIDLVKITKAYMAIIGDGKSRIVQENSLHEANEYNPNAKRFFVEDDGKTFKKFDIILTNPPFGSKATRVLESESKNYDLGHKWKKVVDVDTGEDRYEITDEIIKAPPQELFIERCLAMLKPKGKMAIVLPETYFHAPSKKHIMQFIRDKARITAIVDLPHNTFRPHCNAKTLLLVVQKEREHGDMVFGVAEEIGKNHLGHPKKRIIDGYLTEEIWDDSEFVRKELKNPYNRNNKYVFPVSEKDLKNNVFVPRYYWNNRIAKLKRDTAKIGCDLVPVSALLESGIIEIYRGHGSPGNDYKGSGDVPYVRAGDIGNWAVYKNPTSRVPRHVYESVKGNGVDLKSEDIIFVKEGSYRIGDVALLLPSDTEILLNSHCFVIRIVKLENEYEIDPHYLLYLFSHKLVKDQLYNKVMIDTTLPNIGDRWKELLLPISRSASTVKEIKREMSEIFSYRQMSEALITELTYDK